MKTFDQIIYRIYEAALEPGKWPEALSLIGRRFDAAGATLIFYNASSGTDFVCAPELKPAVEIYLEDEVWKYDLHAQRANEMHVTAGDVFSDHDIATEEEIETHPIYTEHFAKAGLGWLMSAVLLPVAEDLVALTVVRAKAAGPFTPEERDALRVIGRHAEQALRISMQLAEREAGQSMFQQALDTLDAAVYALDAEARPLLRSTLAEAEFSDFFATVEGRMTTRDPGMERQFRAVLEAALCPDRRSPPPSCVLTAPDGRRAVARAIPVDPAEHSLSGLAAAARILVVTTAIDGDQMVDPALLRDVFDLSLGEARLSSLIGGGVTLRAAADRLGVTEGTARQVLKRAFRKLGVNRQAELVLRVSALGGRA